MTRYQLTIWVEGLPKRKPLLGIRPNPYCKVHITGGPRNGTCLGKSDIVRKSINPTFTTIYFIETDPSEYLPIKVCIYDDRKYVDDQYDREIAVANFEITEIYRSKGHLTMQTSNDNDSIK
jgi:Ca2+-dependent lipid-binding protein